MPNSVSRPIIAVTAVYGIFPARPPSFDMLVVPVWRLIDAAIMNKSALPSPLVTYNNVAPVTPSTLPDPRPNKI